MGSRDGGGAHPVPLLPLPPGESWGEGHCMVRESPLTLALSQGERGRCHQVPGGIDP
jgi:hypothetical protein